MNFFRKLLREVRNLFFVLDVGSFLKWLFLFSLSFFQVFRRKTLGVVDDIFGSKITFCVNEKYVVFDGCSLGVVREIVGSECYIASKEMRGFRTILDMGANCGVFSVYALLNAPQSQVLAVEVQPHLVNVARSNLTLCGLSSRIDILNAYVGEMNPFVASLIAGDSSVGAFSPEEYIEKVGECDFLKCDVEGAEYSLISESSFWLRKVKRMSLEYHGIWADGERLGNLIKGHGFEVTQRSHGEFGYLICSRLS